MRDIDILRADILRAVGSDRGGIFWWQLLKLGYTKAKDRSALIGVATTGANP